MADDRRIVIELKVDENAGNSASEKTTDSEDLSKLLKKIQHPIASLEKATLGKSVLIYRAYENTKQFIKDSAMYGVGYYFNLTENYKAEMTLNNTMNVISRVTSIGGSIIGGAIAGSAIPVIGTAVGALVGASAAIANTALNSIKVYNQQNLNLSQMNMQSAFQQTRLGLVDDGRGTMN